MGGEGHIRQAETWRNALSGSGSVPIVPPPTMQWVEKKHKGIQGTRTAGEALGNVLEQTKVSPAQSHESSVRLQANPVGPNAILALNSLKSDSTHS